MTPATIIERADRVLVAIRQGEWKLIVNTETDDVTLYNLGLDPEEQIDLAAQRSEVVQQLYRLLEAWWQAHP